MGSAVSSLAAEPRPKTNLVQSRAVRKPLFAIKRNHPALLSAVLSKVDDFANFKKVEVHAENSTF